MSETPKLLALMAQSRDLPALEYSKQLEALVRQLERENAALRQALEDMPTCRCGLSTDEQCALSFQNAALRKALDYIAGNHGEASPITLTEAQEEARDALAFSKEAQP